ncbi:MAG: HVO_0416 family zinc finger protein [Halodesulfurarchaeum sp.]
MATAETPDDDVLDQFLENNGHVTASWDRSYNKKQCPECGGLHDVSVTTCTVCGWSPQ